MYVITCTRFHSVNQVDAFAKFCYEHGVELHFVVEPYLDISKGKQWRPAVVKAVQSMIESEKNAKRKMIQSLNLSNEQWDYVYECFEMMNLEILSHMF